MYTVDALPSTYIEARTAEYEAKRRAQQQQKALDLPTSNCSSTASTAPNSPLGSPSVGAGAGGLLGFFSTWNRRAEGCAVPAQTTQGGVQGQRQGCAPKQAAGDEKRNGEGHFMSGSSGFAG